MSELKAINAYQLTTNTEDSDVYIHNDEFGCGGDLVECYLKSEVDAAIAELKQKLEDAKATAYAESVENRKLKRALWLARAERAKAMKATENLDNYLSIHENSKWFRIYATRIDTWYYKWDDIERKCLAKAEEYK